MNSLDGKAPDPSDHSAMVIEDLVWRLSAGVDDEHPHELFVELCNACEQAFSQPSPADADILRHCATPHLMRYLLTALRAYNQTTNKNASHRASALGEAFQIVRPAKRGQLRNWTRQHKMELCGAFSRARHAALENGQGRKAAYDAGLAAACSEYRAGQTGEQDDSDRSKLFKKMRGFLNRHGYGNGEFD